MLTPELREFAQIPDLYTWLSPDVERHIEERFGVIQGNVWAGVFATRIGEDELDDLIAEVRARVGDKDTVWWIDPDAEPADLRELLIARGFEVPESGHTLHALACTVEPPPARTGIDVARVDTFEDFAAASEITWDAFDTPAERREQQRALLRQEFDAQQEAQVPVTFLARVDGKPAGVGRSIYSDRGVFLIGGSVAAWARGRGVYRALVRTRWDDAVARGAPGLVTEALPDTSYPILKGLGFEDVCVIKRVKDSR